MPDNTMDPEFHQNDCIILREQNKMSQTELAQLVGVRRETIGHLENGHYNPSLVLAAKIAKVFNVTIEDMFIIIDE